MFIFIFILVMIKSYDSSQKDVSLNSGFDTFECVTLAAITCYLTSLSLSIFSHKMMIIIASSSQDCYED